MTRNFRIGVDGYKHKHNTNVLIVGGEVPARPVPMRCPMCWSPGV